MGYKEQLIQIDEKLSDLYERIDSLDRKLVKIEDLADTALLKASLSHSLIVIRKVGEDKEDELKKLLD